MTSLYLSTKFLIESKFFCVSSVVLIVVAVVEMLFNVIVRPFCANVFVVCSSCCPPIVYLAFCPSRPNVASCELTFAVLVEASTIEMSAPAGFKLPVLVFVKTSFPVKSLKTAFIPRLVLPLIAAVKSEIFCVASSCKVSVTATPVASNVLIWTLILPFASFVNNPLSSSVASLFFPLAATIVTEAALAS